MTHALLSPSSSDRWLACTPAPLIEVNYPNQFSAVAHEGTIAHELAEKALNLRLSADLIAGPYSKEMRKHVQTYLDYVNAISGKLLVEQRLALDPVVPQAFGTSDAVVIDDKDIHVIDLKYGKGVPVGAENNTQLMLYMVGAYLAFDEAQGPFDTFHVHIVQPRIAGGNSSWTFDFDTLAEFMEKVKPLALLAMEGQGERVAGDHCRWCKAKADCHTQMAVNELLNS